MSVFLARRKARHPDRDVMVPTAVGSRRGRQKLWQPLMVTEADLSAAAEIEKQYGSRGAETLAARLKGDYLAFSAMNRLDPLLPSSFRVFGGQLSRFYSPGTLETYLGHVARGRFRYFRSLPFFRAVCARHADAETKSAATFASLNVLEAALNKIKEEIKEPMIHAACEILAISGLRPMDLSRMRSSQMNLQEGVYEVRVTKGRKRRSLRTHLTCAPEWFLGRPVSPSTMQWVMEHPRPFTSLVASKVNAHLKKVHPELTTYSFRRWFIGIVLTFTTSAEEATKYTLHLNSRIVTAHYTPRPLALAVSDRVINAI